MRDFLRKWFLSLFQISCRFLSSVLTESYNRSLCKTGLKNEVLSCVTENCALHSMMVPPFTQCFSLSYLTMYNGLYASGVPLSIPLLYLSSRCTLLSSSTLYTSVLVKHKRLFIITRHTLLLLFFCFFHGE